MVSAVPTTGLQRNLRLHSETGARIEVPVSLQDELRSHSVAGGASVGDHRLRSAIHSGFNARISIAQFCVHDFTLNHFSCGADSECDRIHERINHTHDDSTAF